MLSRLLWTGGSNRRAGRATTWRHFRALSASRHFITTSNGTDTGTNPRSTVKINDILRDEDLVESFVRGRGPGGQAINKNKSCVQLLHIPTGMRVHCQEARDLTTNRRIARKLLERKLDVLFNGPDSYLGRKFDKIRKRKAKARRRQGQCQGEIRDGDALKTTPATTNS